MLKLVGGCLYAWEMVLAGLRWRRRQRDVRLASDARRSGVRAGVEMKSIDTLNLPAQSGAL
jgi:hypothetical protein